MRLLPLAMVVVESAVLAWCLLTRLPETRAAVVSEQAIPMRERTRLEMEMEVNGVVRNFVAYDCGVFLETPEGNKEVLRRRGKYLTTEISQQALGAG